METIPNFSDYAITKEGRVWSKPRKSYHGHNLKGKWMKPGILRSGYRNIVLFLNSQGHTCYVHRLVLETYVGSCPLGMEACHNNGNRKDNRLGNLRWDTRRENIHDAIRHGTFVRGEKHGRVKLAERDVRMIIYMHRTGLFLQREIAKVYKISRQHIGDIINKKKWKHLYAQI